MQRSKYCWLASRRFFDFLKLPTTIIKLCPGCKVAFLVVCGFAKFILRCS
jgi:hypothetical protein